MLEEVKRHEWAYIFAKPVDAATLGLRDYHEIIKRPMDLSTVNTNLTSGAYKTVAQFLVDVDLIWSNAVL